MKLSPKKLLTSVGTGATLSLVYATSALAAPGDTVTNVDALEPLSATSGSSLLGYVGNIVTVILIVVGILAVVYLIYGGILYLTAGGDAEKASKGRVAITNAIIGVVIILLSLAIYQFVLTGVESPTGIK